MRGRITAAVALLGAFACSRAPSTRADLRERLRWPDECESRARQTSVPAPGVEAHALRDGARLVVVQCELGAYQPVSLLYLDRDGAAGTPLVLPGFEPESPGSPPYVAGLPTFDPATRELELLAKDRGAGDCGQLARYAFDGSAPRLRWRRVRECDDTITDPATPPAAWPLAPAR